MKKKLWSIILLLLMLILSGCSAQNHAETTQPSIAEPEIQETEQEVPEETTEMQQEGEITEMDRILAITDESDFVIALSDYIAKKCQYGENMSVLSEAEKVFYITQSLEMEVNNGGFNQYFFNTAGNCCGELVAAFEAIGAVKTAQICQRAMDAFGCEVPADRFARQDLLEELEGTEFDDILDECDGAFYDYEEDLISLNYAYVMKHKDQFH